SHGPETSGETCQYEWSPWMNCALSSSARNAATATSGVVNRLDRRAPAANPSAENAGRVAMPIMAGHHNGPPQAPCRAVTAYRTPTQPRYATIAQQVVAAQVA